MYESFNRVIHSIVPAIIISFASVVILRSIAPNLAQYQLIFAVIGILVAIMVSRLSIDPLKITPWFWYLVTLIPLLATELFGVVSRGSARWIMVSGFKFQTSEFAKISLVLFAASWLSRQPTEFGKTTLKFIGLMVLPASIVFFQPDLGTALMYIFIAFIGLLAAGTPMKHFLIIALIVGILTPLFFFTLKPYQLARIENFISPQNDPLGGGYNARQSTIAIGSGQWVGKGIGQGTQSHLRFLPERQTDFAFASFVEELGFLGGFVLIAVYIWLFVGIISIAKGMKSVKQQLYTLITGGILITQSMVNMGMNMGLLPITGITLPLFSYGGSSILSTYAMLGFVVNFAIKSHGSGKHLEIR